MREHVIIRSIDRNCGGRASLRRRDSKPGCRAEPPRPAAEDDVARWNDRSSPRKTLETFFFSIYCYDLAPELIVNAIDCMELGELDPAERERDAALMAHELAVIITLCFGRVAVWRSDEDRSGTLTIVDDGPIQIALSRQADGTWRFTRETIEHIPQMRAALAGQREQQQARMHMVEGRHHPDNGAPFCTTCKYGTTLAKPRGAWTSDIPPKLRGTQGPDLARKLLFVIQRCGFMFPQEFPSDPDGWRFIWHSNHRGRIMVDRVRLPDGKDAWLFSRMTLHNLDALVEGFKDARRTPGMRDRQAGRRQRADQQ